MDRGGSHRVRPAVAVLLVVAVAAALVVILRGGSPLDGEVDWRATYQDLGFVEGGSAHPHASSEAFTTVGGGPEGQDDVMVRVDQAGQVRRLPAEPIAMRDDGSGWGRPLGDGETDVEAAADSDVTVVGWNAAGEQTVLIGRDDVLAMVESGGLDVSLHPDIELWRGGYTDDTVVFNGCEERRGTPGEWLLISLAVDIRTGDVLWDQSAPEPCFTLFRGGIGSDLFIDPILRSADDATPPTVRHIATGEALWSEPDGAVSVAGVAGEVFWWVGPTLSRLDARSGQAAWEQELCVGDPGRREVLAIGGVGSQTVMARCGTDWWVIDVASGRYRELPEGTTRNSGDVGAPRLGTVLIEVEGDALVATDPLTDERRWRHDLEDAGDIVRLQSGAGPRATVTLISGEIDGEEGDPSRRGRSVEVLDARSGAIIAEADPGDGTWEARSMADGGVLLVHTEGEESQVFKVSGGRVD